MSDKTLSFQELPGLRKKTEAISAYLEQRLHFYLETLRPTLTPERLLGKHVAGKSEIPGADKAVAQIAHDYEALTGKPLALPRGFDADALLKCLPKLSLHRYSYTHQIAGDRGPKPIHMTQPLRWILTYTSDLSPLQVIDIAAGKDTAKAEALGQYVVNALVLQLMLTRTPGLAELFNDLRFTVAAESFPRTGQLPFVTMTSFLPSFRPADDLILAATEFSGVPAFIELVDLEAIKSCRHPLEEAIDRVLQG
jgi:hypothetical protein